MIAVCTPARESVHAAFAHDLTELLSHTTTARWYVALGSLLSNLRHKLTLIAIENKATHILWIDSDMQFPKDTLERLLQHNKAIVGANCRVRTEPHKQLTTAWKDGEAVNSENKVGLEKVDSIGFGVCLINTDVFKTVPQPWYAMPFDGTRYIGEDAFFMHKAKGVNIDPFVDHDLSHEIGHYGTVSLTVA